MSAYIAEIVLNMNMSVKCMIRVLLSNRLVHPIFRYSVACYHGNSGTNFIEGHSTKESDTGDESTNHATRTERHSHGQSSNNRRLSSRNKKIDPDWFSGETQKTQRFETGSDFVSRKGRRPQQTKVDKEWFHGSQSENNPSRLSDKQDELNPEDNDDAAFGGVAPEYGEFFKPIHHDKGIQELLMAQLPEQPADPHLLKVAIIGTPNTGKSTLINSLLGRRIFSVSHKVHTTRSKAFAVINQDNTQIVVLDTPGIVDYKKARKHKLARSLIVDHRSSLLEADLVAVLVDASHERGKRELHFEILKQLCLHPDMKSILVLNKVDLLKHKHELIGITARLTGGKVAGRSFEISKADAAKIGSIEKGSLMKMSYRAPSVDRDDDNDEVDAGSDHRYWWQSDDEKSASSLLGLEEPQQTIDVDRSLSDCEQPNEGGDSTISTDADPSIAVSEQNSEVSKHHITDFSPHRTDIENLSSDGRAVSDCSYTDSSPHRNDAEILASDGVEDVSDRSITDSSTHSIDEESCKDNIMKEYVDNLKDVGEFLGAPERVPLTKLEEEAEARKQESEKKKQEDRELNRKVANMQKRWTGFDAVFMVSAKQGLGVADLKEYLLDHATPCDWEYHGDVITSLTPEEIVKEAIREQLLELLFEEIPYLIQQKTLIYEMGENGDLKIIQELICPKTSHARILEKVIGKVATRAQQQLMNAFHHEVHLMLHVSVDKKLLRKLGR